MQRQAFEKQLLRLGAMATKGKQDSSAIKVGMVGGLIAVVATGVQFGLLVGIAVFGTFLFFLSLTATVISRLIEGIHVNQQPKVPESR
jgi:hypothetical protein